MIKQFPDDSDSIAGDTIYAATAKATPVDADKIGYWDSVSGLFRSMTWANVTATLLTYFTDKGIGAYNDILNGNFQIAQRGTSFAAPATGAYDLDGWVNNNVSAAVFTVAQVAGSVAGRMCRQVTITTADAAIAAGEFVMDSHRMVGYDIAKYVGNTFTVSFRAKFPVTGIHCVSLRNIGTAGASDRSYIHEINVASADTWAEYSFVVTGGLPTDGTWNYTTGRGLYLGIAHACGSTYQTTPDAWNTGYFFGTANQVNDLATVGNVWALEEVKLNLGTVPTQHQISEAEMLVRCQQRYEVGTARRDLQGTNTAAESCQIIFKTTKLITPTMSLTNTAANNYNATPNTVQITTEGFAVYHIGTATGAAAFVDSWTATSEPA
ncbi:MAG: hypothetical protein WC236_14530 [Gallionellaceae bacterium]|jgi:hypothetical protein